MHAVKGDWIVIRGKSVGVPDRHGKIMEVRGKEGGPPYYVKFDDGHESVVYPGSDVVIEHIESV
jgi:Domain of unknown function (DUF1918)